jgi:hypothetical protein
MSKTKQIWVSPSEDGWRAHKPGATRSIANTGTKQEAYDAAREVAINQGLELIVQNKDGKIGVKNTYPKSRDNCPPRG